MSELKETKKMKVIQLHEPTPKQFSNPTPTQKIAPQSPKKSKMTPKLSQNQMSELKKRRKRKLFNYMSRSKNRFRTLPQPQKQPIRAPKIKNDPKIKQKKSNIRIEENIQNESCSTTWVHPKTVFEPFLNHINSPLGPPKSQK